MKILATHDGSKEARAIIPMLTRLAKETDAEVTLLTVLTESPAALARKGPAVAMVTPGGQMGATTIQVMRSEAFVQPTPPKWEESKDQAVERAESEARDSLADFAAPLKKAGVRVREEVAAGDDAAAAIIAFARDGKYDLIAMATHGRTGLRQVVQGSVATAVLKSGIAPVLLVRPNP
jgi:nucleotide-binding universal stress UspA family protein